MELLKKPGCLALLGVNLVLDVLGMVTVFDLTLQHPDLLEQGIILILQVVFWARANLVIRWILKRTAEDIANEDHKWDENEEQ